MASTTALAGYKVGEISQALLKKHRKAKTEKEENVELNALFSSASLFQPEFVPLAPKISKKTTEERLRKHIKKTEVSPEVRKHPAAGDGGPLSRLSRKRRLPTSDDEDEEALVKKPRKKNKKSNEDEEDPERLARTVFVGNLPVAFTRKKLKQLFAIYGEVESVRFRSAALAKPDLSRKVAMKRREFHSDRHNINGYVVFKEKECAVKSLESNGIEVDGFHIRVDLTGQKNQHDHTKSIFVGNLPFDTEEEPLRQAFVDCGDVEAVRIIRDSKTGAGKGFGFILFKWPGARLAEACQVLINHIIQTFELKQRDAVTFALKKNKTKFCGRPLRIFPSSENPQQGHSRDVKKGRPVAYSFSGITAKRGMKTDHKGKKKQRFAKGPKGVQGFGTKPARNNFSGGKNWKFQQRGNDKMHHPKNKNRASKISKNNSKKNSQSNRTGKPR